MIKSCVDDVLKHLIDVRSKSVDSTELERDLDVCIETLSDVSSKIESYESVLNYFAERCSQGKIREIPCCPGDTIYFVDILHGDFLKQYTCGEIIISEDSMNVSMIHPGGSSMYIPIEAFGDYVFTDYNEAHRRLEDVRSSLPDNINM